MGGGVGGCCRRRRAARAQTRAPRAPPARSGATWALPLARAPQAPPTAFGGQGMVSKKLMSCRQVPVWALEASKTKKVVVFALPSLPGPDARLAAPPPRAPLSSGYHRRPRRWRPARPRQTTLSARWPRSAGAHSSWRASTRLACSGCRRCCVRTLRCAPRWRRSRRCCGRWRVHRLRQSACYGAGRRVVRRTARLPRAR